MPELEQISRLRDVADQIENVALSDDPGTTLYELAQEIRAVTDDTLAQAIPKRRAAEFLDISEDTVERWLRHGVLKSIRSEDSPKEFVSSESILSAHDELRRLRREGADRRFFHRLLSKSAQTMSARPQRRKYGGPLTRKGIGLEEDSD